jgi:hypothetical protein
MPNPLKQSVRSGVKANDTIGDLIADVGTRAHPRGFVTTAFRNTRRALQSALQEHIPLAAVDDVMLQFRETVRRETAAIFSKAQEAGAEESARQMRFYGIVSPDPAQVSMMLSEKSQSALDAVLADVDKKRAGIRTMVLMNSDDEEILGDDDRSGFLGSGGELGGLIVFWMTGLLWDAFDWWTGYYSGGLDFQKQAVAALDMRTTDCCLRVHGQVQPMHKPFWLTGTPRFADYVDWPGFHWYCRTSGVLYLAEFDDGITAKMQDGARYFLDQRAKGNSPDRDPANAF